MSLLTTLTHHAVLIVHNNRITFGDTLWNELQLMSPAHRFFNHTVLDIDTARSIIQWANTPYNDEKVALISFHTASIPAQNAMLKIIEEPRANVRFIIVTAHKESIIETLYSRLQHNHVDDMLSTKNTLLVDNALLFLSSFPSSRMKLPFVTGLLTATDEEGRKDREGVKTFILTLTDILKKNKEYSAYTLETLQVAMYASDPSASGKALIEYLSLLLPQTKL